MTDYYKLSNEKMKAFQDTLKRFTDILRTREMFKKLGVEIKEPKDWEYNLDYVLSIAKLIEERRGEADKLAPARDSSGNVSEVLLNTKMS